MTEQDLYAMGMESETAYKHMRELCEMAGVKYPPQPAPREQKSMVDPLLEVV